MEYTNVDDSLVDLVENAYESNFYQVNTLLVAEIGFMAAVFFEIIYKWGKRVKQKTFYMQSAEITNMHGLTYKQQYTMFNKLSKLGLITCSVNRIEKKKYVTVNHERLGDILVMQSDVRSEKIKAAKKARIEYYKNRGK